MFYIVNIEIFFILESLECSAVLWKLYKDVGSISWKYVQVFEQNSSVDLAPTVFMSWSHEIIRFKTSLSKSVQ